MNEVDLADFVSEIVPVLWGLLAGLLIGGVFSPGGCSTAAAERKRTHEPPWALMVLVSAWASAPPTRTIEAMAMLVLAAVCARRQAWSGEFEMRELMAHD